ncbi:hypothetical protein [Amycolatopsis methanolica]|nr:hypothetical protein [Amycolatopsis methanolica]
MAVVMLVAPSLSPQLGASSSPRVSDELAVGAQLAAAPAYSAGFVLLAAVAVVAAGAVAPRYSADR